MILFKLAFIAGAIYALVDFIMKAVAARKEARESMDFPPLSDDCGEDDSLDAQMDNYNEQIDTYNRLTALLDERYEMTEAPSEKAEILREKIEIQEKIQELQRKRDKLL